MILKGIPIEKLPAYLKRPYVAMRNHSLIRSGAIRQYFSNHEKNLKIIDPELTNWFDEDSRTFKSGYSVFTKDDEPSYNYYIHIDGSLGGDAMGIACCHCEGFKDIIGENREGRAPLIVYDWLGRIRPKIPGDKLTVGDSRQIIYEFGRHGGLVSLITFDGFQSADSVIYLQREGYVAQVMSIDAMTTYWKLDYGNTPAKKVHPGNPIFGYEAFLTAILQEQIRAPYHEYIMKELAEQEEDTKRKRVYKMQGGTDDLLQSMIGSYVNCYVNTYDYEQKELTTEEKIFHRDQNRKVIDMQTGNEVDEFGDQFDSTYDTIRRRHW